MKKIFKLLVLALVIVPCMVIGVACNNKAKECNLSLELTKEGYTMQNNIVTVTYGTKVELLRESFNVLVVYKNQTTKNINDIKGGVDNLNFSSTLPSEEITPVGSYTLTFTYKKLDPVCVTVVVEKADVDVSGVSWDYENKFVYDGTEKQVQLINLPEGVSVEYKDDYKATNAGLYTATAVLTYEDELNFNKIETKTIKWRIHKATMNIETVYLNSFTYDGTEKAATISEGSLLPEGVVVDTLSGDTKATNAGIYDVEIKFKHTGEGAVNYIIPSIFRSWQIEKAVYHVDESTIALKEDYDFTYDGQLKSVLLDEEKLDSNVRLVNLVGEEAVLPGKYTLVIYLEYVGVNPNYSSVESVIIEDAWEIKKAVLTVTANNQTINYGEQALNGSYTIQGFVNDEDQSVLMGEVQFKYFAKGTQTEYVIGDSVGEYDIVLSGLSADNYEINYVNGILNVLLLQVNAADLVWVNPVNMTYTGVPIKPTLDNVPSGIVIGYSYKKDGVENNSVDVGKYVAEATITTNGDNFELVGNIDIYNYEIVKATISSVDSVVLKVDELTYSGYEQTIASTLEDFNNVPSGVKISAINGNTAKDVGLGYKLTVTFIQDDSENYNEFNQVKEFTWRINPKELTLTVNSGTYLYGDEMPTGYTVEGFVGEDTEDVIKGVACYIYEGYVDGVEGEYPITIGDRDLYANNYFITIVPGVMTVQTIKIDVSNFVWQDVSDYTYNEQVQGLSLIDVPEHVVATYVYKKNGVVVANPIDAGDYIVAVTLTPVSPRYELVGELSVKELAFVINKADLDISGIEWDYDKSEPFVYDGTEKQVQLINVPKHITIEYNGKERATNARQYKAEAVLSHVDKDNYVSKEMSVSWRIVKQTITVSIGLSNYDYDGTEKVATIYTSLPENIVVDRWEGATRAIDAGMHDVVIHFRYIGENSSNYTVAYVNTSWMINPIAYVEPEDSVFLTGDKIFTYDGKSHAVNLDTTGLSENVAIVGINGLQGDQAGKYSVIINLQYVGDSKNYSSAKSIVLEDAWEIKKVQLAVKVENNTITYGQEAAGVGFEISGFINGELEEYVISGSAYYTFSGYEVGSPVGEYKIYVEGLYATNYELVCSPGILTVEKLKVDVSELVWQNNNQTTYEYTGEAIKPELDLSLVPSCVQVVGYRYTNENQEFVTEPKEVGEYTVTAYLKAVNDNYEIVNSSSLIFTIVDLQQE